MDVSNGAEGTAPETGVSKSPADFLKSIKGKPVVVKLNSGVDYRGTRIEESCVWRQRQRSAWGAWIAYGRLVKLTPCTRVIDHVQASWRAWTVT